MGMRGLQFLPAERSGTSFEHKAAEQQIFRWRQQAAEARSLAREFQSLEARRQMLEISAAYERMVAFAEARLSTLR